jgi:hypothetical protein
VVILFDRSFFIRKSFSSFLPSISLDFVDSIFTRLKYENLFQFQELFYSVDTRQHFVVSSGAGYPTLRELVRHTPGVRSLWGWELGFGEDTRIADDLWLAG